MPREAEFTGPYFVTAFGPHGEATLLDQIQARVSIFDGATGRFIRAFGRSGRGPGELHAPGAMTWDPYGRLWVANSFDGRYTVFDSTGDLIKTIQRLGISTNRRVFPMVVTGSGTIVDHAIAYPNVRILLMDSTGVIEDSVRFRLPDADDLGGGIIRPGSALLEVLGLRPHLHWSLARDGKSIWLVRSDSLSLVQLSATGDTLRHVYLSHRTGTFTREQRESIRRANRELDRDGDFVPMLVQAVHALNDGRVLVQIGNTSEPGREFELFDSTGRWLGTVHAPFAVHHRSELASRGDTLLVSAVGELDVPLLIKAVLKPSNR